MPQIFHQSANVLARFLIVSLVILIFTVSAVAVAYYRSSYSTKVGVTIDQPVPFSHQHHVQVLGVDCRFCHNSVETSKTASLPATEICMKCHSQLWTNANLLAPVRESFENNEPIHWNRVHKLPDFVFFNHSIHVSKGIGCSTCHGRVDRMPLMAKAESLHMQWCLQCHRNPEIFVRPKDQVFEMTYPLEPNPEQAGQQLVETNQIQTRGLTDCQTCHR
ncbi:MAG: cytochrome c3 family protein [Candidatus Omnitrophica bacterium]|nr:cytochrome c3 family protein [Candidatus Omnitrophota bacterium]MCA9446371.1 cytochrome c3 family protein [Candidatus Omnitrophota bacterium]MCB9769461.1 cytochrome c3 family protein [Candidatus Omnitrophota bacterium]